MTVQLSPEQVLAGFGVLVALVWVWRAGSRRARRAAEAARAGSRVVSLAGRVLLTAGCLVGVQWLVITYVDNLTVLLVVLSIPDVIAAHVLTRALTVTELGTTRRPGDRR
ncbi:hypothetical protein SAMN05421810_104205 [Amycolatopsis arida]|uniref:Uncharacterized protein n=1 Tax=Amycolatopsis arida TaxID=587909 RepID=A0A1I5V2F9_9PSEU|nr:hypothetical protein [Amycolatopsis arida]TDX91122.1 hypothetical protein CLV69_106204 [Amycolatopsis arida]SFQ01651.1 hypothetical protein SAMN05421810_104205 [Amycolatopsis arida]